MADQTLAQGSILKASSRLETGGEGATEVGSLQAGDVDRELGARLYLDLMKKCLTRYIFPDTYRPLERPSWRNHPFVSLVWPIYSLIDSRLSAQDIRVLRYETFDSAMRTEGRDWPAQAETMVGLKRLENLQFCIEDVLRANVPGDLIETGVWRGGASIFMRAVLKAYGDRTRTVWLADSFEGLPKPDGRYPQDAGDILWKENSTLGVSLEQVKANFARYDMLDDQVRFLVGWFKDTLPTAPISRLAILRLDGDMYASTMDALASLYPKLSRGGYVIVDDYGAVSTCKRAVDDFRTQCGITEPIEQIDYSGVFWQKASRR